MTGGIQQLGGQEGGGGGVSKKSTLVHPGGSQDVHVDKIFKKGTEESRQMTKRIIISSIFEDAVHRRLLNLGFFYGLSHL